MLDALRTDAESQSPCRSAAASAEKADERMEKRRKKKNRNAHEAEPCRRGRLESRVVPRLLALAPGDGSLLLVSGLGRRRGSQQHGCNVLLYLQEQLHPLNAGPGSRAWGPALAQLDLRGDGLISDGKWLEVKLREVSFELLAKGRCERPLEKNSREEGKLTMS